MKIDIKGLNAREGQMELIQLHLEKFKFFNTPDDFLMSIDGGTGQTGISIFRINDKSCLSVISVIRKDDTTPVRFKVGLKKLIAEILLNNKSIKYIVYEEPYLDHEYVTSAEKLFMLKSVVEEAIIENEPNLDDRKLIYINNMKWKKLFLLGKVPSGTQLQKKAISDRVDLLLPCLKGCIQDVKDSVGMGFAASIEISNDNVDTLKSKKKAKAFEYNVEFIGADIDEDLFNDFEYFSKRVPTVVKQNGISMIELKSRNNFDKKIYEGMGDSDILLVIKFRSDTFGNIILKHRLAHLSDEYDYIYALVWRKSRRKR